MAKREAVMDILEFISTDEGQNLLIEDNIGMVSTVKGAVIPADKVFDGIRRAVMQGNYVMRLSWQSDSCPSAGVDLLYQR